MWIRVAIYTLWKGLYDKITRLFSADAALRRSNEITNT